MVGRIDKCLAMLVLSLLLVAIPVSYVTAQDGAIQAVVDAWPELLDSGDIDGLLNLFAADVVFRHPSMPVVLGRDSLRAFVSRVFRQQTSAGSSMRVERIQTSSDWAHVEALFSTTWRPTDGSEPFPENARYLWVLHRGNDAFWRVKTFVFYPIR